jgi:hypothetical protein
VIDVALLTVNEVAGMPSNVTAVAPVNPVPVIIALLPPAIGPPVGEMLAKVGGAV